MCIDRNLAQAHTNLAPECYLYPCFAKSTFNSSTLDVVEARSTQSRSSFICFRRYSQSLQKTERYNDWMTQTGKCQNMLENRQVMTEFIQTYLDCSYRHTDIFLYIQSDQDWSSGAGNDCDTHTLRPMSWVWDFISSIFFRFASTKCMEENNCNT